MAQTYADIQTQVLVDETTGCWHWQRSKDTYGYGHLWVDGRIQLAHRWSYMTNRGPIPEGLELDHLCRNRACINPDHLEPVSHAQNVRRGRARKLTDDDVTLIFTSNETNRALGRRLGVSDVRVSQIRKRGW
jgi:hypothetical protein